MAVDIYAKIQGGSVINTELVDSSDSSNLDPTFTWVDITSITPQPGIGWTYNGTTFTAPAPPTQTPTQIYTAVVMAAMGFGQQLTVQFAVANILAGITQAGQTQAVMNYTTTLSQCLNTGSLYAAITNINTMIADSSSTKTALAPFITNDILYSYLNQIQTYLGIALTTNPGS